MTTTDGESHLYSFGEFAALYLTVWSNACWPLPTEWPKAKDVYAPPGLPGKVTPAPEYEFPLKWDALTADDVDEKDGEKYKDCADLKDAALRSVRAAAATEEARSASRDQGRADDQVLRGAAEGAPHARQRADVHDHGRSRRDRRLEPESDLGRAREQHDLRSRDPAQRARLLHGVSGLGQRPGALSQRGHRRGRRSEAHARHGCQDVSGTSECHGEACNRRGAGEKRDGRARQVLRSRPAAEGAADRRLRPGDAADQMALVVQGTEVSDGRARQSHAPQLRVARRTARQRLPFPRRKTRFPRRCRQVSTCSSSSRRCRCWAPVCSTS